MNLVSTLDFRAILPQYQKSNQGEDHVYEKMRDGVGSAGGRVADPQLGGEEE